MAKDLKQVADKESVLLAEHEDRLIGFALSVSDYNQVFKKNSRRKIISIWLAPPAVWKKVNQSYSDYDYRSIDSMARLRH